MSATDLSICKTALLLVGADEINSFEDGSREARICDAVYTTTKESLIQTHPWSFTLEQTDLARTTQTPVIGDFEYVYQLPVNSLKVIRKDGLQNDYRIYQDKLFSSDDVVSIIHQIDPGEQNFPSYFTRALEFKMAELLAASLAQDETLTQIMQDKFIRAVREAKSADSQTQPNILVNSSEFSVAAVRRS